jgi:hypothetical protein
MPASNLTSQDYQFSYQTAQGRWKWTTRLDLAGQTPKPWVINVETPWGLLRDTTPLPGEVVQAMSGSIDQLMQAFPPTILVGPPTALTFNVDAGRGRSEPQTVLVTNDGTYGSILNAVLITSANWIVTQPGNVPGLSANQSGSFDVSVDTTGLVPSGSPYSGSVIVQDPRSTNNPQTIPVTVNVRPLAHVATDLALLIFNVPYSLTGVYPAVPVQQFHVMNAGAIGSLLDYQLQKVTGLSNWLASFSPPTGQVVGGASQPITVLVQPCPNSYLGTYEETLRVSGYSDNLYTDVLIRLVIS